MVIRYTTYRKRTRIMKEQKPQSLKDIIIAAFSIKEDTAPNSEIQERLHSAGKVTGTNLCMMTCANLIACIGCNLIGYLVGLDVVLMGSLENGLVSPGRIEQAFIALLLAL